MAHHHHHTHNHATEHHHKPANTQGRIFTLAILLNMAFVVLEFSYGFIANSTALMADAGHNASDVLGLLLAWELSYWHVSNPTNAIPMAYAAHQFWRHLLTPVYFWWPAEQLPGRLSTVLLNRP